MNIWNENMNIWKENMNIYRDVNKLNIKKNMLINTKEAVRYLGYRDSWPDEEMINKLYEAEKELIDVMNPQYTLYGADVIKIDDSYIIGESGIKLKGKSIKKYLEGCRTAVLCCMTLSSQVDLMIDNKQKDDMLNALLIDATANAAIESLREIIENELADIYCLDTIQSMFGFGYGDLNMEYIPDVLKFLNTETEIKVSCNDSCLLIPMKSICGVIGIYDKAVNDKKNCKRTCLSCNIKDTCLYFHELDLS